MKTESNFAISLLISFAILGNGWISAQEAPEPERKTDRNGIASRFLGDVGIGQDPDVVFIESFDKKSVRDVFRNWESIKAGESMAVSDDTPHGIAGKSLRVVHRGGRGTGSHLYRRLDSGYDQLFYRFYVKFDQDCAPIHHFFHVGGYQPATAWPQGGAGQRPHGDDRLTTGIEPFGKNWRWDYYSYWMEMRGSPPRGQTWGNSFINDPELKVTRGKWQCIELMMKLNEVGERNGEMALWIDGQKVSHLKPGSPKGKWVFDKFLPGKGGDGIRWNDKTGGREAISFPEDGGPFEGFHWRNDENLKLNFVWLLCYITKSPRDHVSKIWFDQIVVARKYIGPIQTR